MSRKKSEITGVWTALITPFDEQGEVDYDSFAKLVEEQMNAGVSGVVISGTTGESPTLTTEEKIKLIQRCVEVSGDELGIMAGTGNNNTKESVDLSKAAVEAGADSILVVTPPYNKPSLSGLKLHFETVAAAVSVPVCLYHVPGRTAQKLTAEQIAELCTIKSVVAVKEASADLALFAECERRCDATLLSGDDPTYLASLGVGGKGCISVASNVFPKAMVAMTEAALNGDYEKAQKINRTLLPAISALFVECNPCPTKYVLSQRGIGKNVVRAPLVPVSKDSEKVIDAALKGEGLS